MFAFVRRQANRKAALARLNSQVKGIKRIEVTEELDLRVENPRVVKILPSGLLG